MKKYFVKNNSDKLLLFFAGWGCDEAEFEHLKAESDVLILYDYSDLTLDFDFSKYKKYDLLAFSAGVFIASIFNFGFTFDRKIAVSGNPYLFDEHLGLTEKIQDILYNVTEENADEFAKNYLVKTDYEYEHFHPSKRTIDSCRMELDCLKKIYQAHKQDIKDIFDKAIFGEEDLIFNPTVQKEYYEDRLQIVKNTRHNPFFKVETYEQILNLHKKEN